MRDEDKPFVCYKQGWNMKIVPRGAAGWRAFGLWMASLGLMVAVFLAAMEALREPAMQTTAAVAFVVIVLIWAVAMIRWMMARSEIVDLNELMKLKRESESRRARGGTRIP